MDKKTGITLSLLLLNLFIAFLGIGLIIPVLPTIMNELNINGTTIGYLTAAFALTQLIASPFAGKAADKFGRKIMIVLGLFIFGLSEMLFGFGKTVEVLFISRILGGLSAAFIMPAVTAFIADITTLATRPKALGYMSAAISTGFIVGPGIGSVLAEIGTRVPFFTAAALGFFAALLSAIILKEPERSEETMVKEGDKQSGNWKKLLLPMFLIAFIVIFVSSFGLAAFESFFSLYVDQKHAFTYDDIAIAIMGGGIIGAIFQVALFDRLTRWIGEINLIKVSLFFTAVLVYLMTVANTYWVIMAVTFTVFVGFDLIRPAVSTYLSRLAGSDQGFVGGMNSLFTSLANCIGPILGGMLYDENINYPYYFAAIVIAIGLVISIFWKEPSVEKSKQLAS